jgi:hypothetical protein
MDAWQAPEQETQLRRFFVVHLADEHIHGSLFIALGENRYMGGQNASSLNKDYALRLSIPNGELVMRNTSFFALVDTAILSVSPLLAR